VLESSIQTSKGRARLARVLRAAGDLVTVDDACGALDVDRRTAAKLLARWAEQGWLKRLRRGVYSPIPVDAVSADRTLENPWVLVRSSDRIRQQEPVSIEQSSEPSVLVLTTWGS